MNLTDDDILKFQRGTPVLLEDICAIRSVTLGQIVDIGYSKFQQYLGILTTTKPVDLPNKDSELANLLNELTDFQYILMMCTMDPIMNSLGKEAFKFFTGETVIFSLDPPQIVIGPIEEKHLLTEEHFYDFQKILRRMYFLEQ